MERVADYIISRLTENNIKHIFLVTGRGILHLTDAVAKNPDIKGVSTLHEQGASYAAMAYALANDSMSACLVSTGCAATNAVTAVLCAYQDNLPVIFISGQHMLNETTRYTGCHIRTFGSQETDIVEVVKPITKYSVMIESKDDIAYEMDRAFYFANEGRKGPVWIDVPLDVQNARVDRKSFRRFFPEVTKAGVDSDIFSTIADELTLAKRPVVLIGGGVRAAGAANLVKALAETNNVPVVFSPSAADVYGSGNRYSIGAIGSIGGSRAGNFTIQNADYILAIGSKLCSQSIGDKPSHFAREAKITVVDIDGDEHAKPGASIDRLIVSDAGVFLTSLAKKIIERNDEWLNQCISWKDIFSVRNETFIKELSDRNEIDLYRFADVLSDELSDNATVITDAGLEELIIPSTIRFCGDQRCLFPASQGAMGYAIPAIIGAHYAERNNIVCVVGDGSIMMNLQELLVIKDKNIPVKVFVINNNMYAVIRRRQKDLFRHRTIGTDPSDGVPAPNFKAIADCFGFAYRNIKEEKSLANEIRATLMMDEACICEVYCTPDQKFLHTSFAFNEKKKLIRRPLEDQSPFLDREFIKRQMVIPMVDE